MCRSSYYTDQSGDFGDVDLLGMGSELMDDYTDPLDMGLTG